MLNEAIMFATIKHNGQTETMVKHHIFIIQ